MSYIYNFSLERKDIPNYHRLIDTSFFSIPTHNLEDIDTYTKEKSKEELIDKILEANLFPDSKTKENLDVMIAYKDTKIRVLPLLCKDTLESYPQDLASFVEHLTEPERKRWYTYLEKYLKKGHITETIKRFIIALRADSYLAAKTICFQLTYEEKRFLQMEYQKRREQIEWKKNKEN